MQKNLKSFLTVFLIIALCVIMVGCSGNAPNQPEQAAAEAKPPVAQEQAEAAPEPEEEKVRTIIDQQGYEVVLPEKLERIVISTIWPLPSVYSLFMGSGEGLVGVSEGSRGAAEYSLLPRVAPEILEADTKFVQGRDVNVEELLKLNPDVVFYRGENIGEREIYEKAGITAVAFNTTSEAAGNTIDTVGAWIKLLGEIFDREERAQEIMDYGYEKLAMIQERVDTLDESERVRSLFLFRYHEGQIAVAGEGHFGHFWLESTGAINVAAEVSGAPDVNMEQIYEWNPDKIFITNFSIHFPEDLYNNNVGNHDWSSVKAVQNREVYKAPLGMYRWYPPSSDTPLMLQWVAKMNYPELFADIDMEKEVKDYFMRFYGVELTDEDINMIFNPAREAAEGA